MEDTLGDLSQLLAFADSLGDSGMPLMREDLSPTSAEGITESIPWHTPPLFTYPKPSAIAVVIDSIRSGDVGIKIGEDSPGSPIQKARTSLFGSSDKPSEIEVCDEGLDPRGVFIIDHPGRHAQFKQWYLSGFLTDDTRRVTLREEGSKPSPLTPKDSPALQREGSPEGIVGLLLQTKPDSSKSDMHALFETLKPSDEGLDERAITTPPPDWPSPSSTISSWKNKTFIMGKQLMIAMGDTAMCDGEFPTWCAWFSDLIRSYGLSDRVSTSLTNRSQVVNADIDFSRNALSDSSILEIVRVFSNFRRINVRTLRISGNAVTDIGLIALAELPHLQQLFLSDNLISRLGLFEFVLTSRKSKLDIYEASVAQDQPDESLLRPMSISIEGNLIENAMGLLSDFESCGFKTCCPDSSGCDGIAQCRIFGQECGVHLSGLGCQRKPDQLTFS